MNVICLADTDEDIEATFSVMRQLRPHLAESEYLPLIRELQQQYAYQLAALYDENQKTAAVCGFRIGQSLAWGRYVYIDDLVSGQANRSQGFGKALLAWVANYGRERGCAQLHLDSGVQRNAAHRFYLRERMDIVFYHFRLDIDPSGNP